MRRTSRLQASRITTEPAVAAAAADDADLVEVGGAVLGSCTPAFGAPAASSGTSPCVANVLALQSAGRMHRGIGQCAVGGQEQQTGRVDVRRPRRSSAHPLSRGSCSNTVGRPSGRRAWSPPSGCGRRAPGCARPRRRTTKAFAVGFHTVAGLDAQSQGGDLAVDLGFAGLDALFERRRERARHSPAPVQALFETGAASVFAAARG